MARISIAVCTRQCPSSSVLHNQHPHEIIYVVDNIPSNPNIKVIHNPDGGLSNARNKAIDACTGDYIAFIDDDATPLDGWLEVIDNVIETEHPDIVGTGVTSCYPGFPKSLNWLIGCTSPDTVRPIGCSFVVRTSLARRVRFNPRIGKRDGKGYVGEETDFMYRAQPCTIRFIPQDLVIHNIPEYRTHLPYLCKRAYWEGRSKALIGTSSVEVNKARDYILSFSPTAYLVLLSTTIGFIIEK